MASSGAQGAGGPNGGYPVQSQHESAWYHTRRLDGREAGAALADATLGRRRPLVDGGSKPLEA